jgi:hypothetical protein
VAKDKLKIHRLLGVMTASQAAVTQSHNHRVTEKDVLIEKEADLLARIAKLKEDDLRSEPLRVEDANVRR